MKFIWYLSIFFVLISVLLDNPKKSSSGVFNSQNQLLTPTRSAQKNLQILIATSISIFFLLTIFLVVTSQILY